ncbi:hypothetical protein HUU53_01905 [Candidatus Micrarchaeota archaeon]|nr:hypothetical protein [Candidatus Micrarchaeota archaeon]
MTSSFSQKDMRKIRESEKQKLVLDITKPTIKLEFTLDADARKNVDKLIENFLALNPHATKQSVQNIVAALKLIDILPPAFKEKVLCSFIAGSTASGKAGATQHYSEHVHFIEGKYAHSVFDKLNRDAEEKRIDTDVYFITKVRVTETKELEKRIRQVRRLYPKVNFDINIVFYGDLINHLTKKEVSNYRGILGTVPKLVIEGYPLVRKLEKISKKYLLGEIESLDFSNELDMRVKKRLLREFEVRGIEKLLINRAILKEAMPYIVRIRLAKLDIGDHRGITLKIKIPNRSKDTIVHEK